MIRLCWLLLVLFAGTGILAYILMWIVLPVAPPEAVPATTSVQVAS
jgi:phage shock protein PspC (stress-responsive transcriptional regulator)